MSEANETCEKCLSNFEPKKFEIFLKKFEWFFYCRVFHQWRFGDLFQAVDVLSGRRVKMRAVANDARPAVHDFIAGGRVGFFRL